MKLPRWLIRSSLFLPYGFRKLTRTGPFVQDMARYMDHPDKIHGNRLKQALFKHHVKQFHDSSCSVASVVTIVNAIRDCHGGMDGPIDQADILETVNTGNWKERMGPSGHHGKRGLPLPLLGEVVRSSLEVYGIKYCAIETVAAQKDADQSPSIMGILRKRLIDFEKKGDRLLIAHFNQGVYVKTLNIPHISPVGGFDPTSDRVTVLDVDPSQQPYSIPFDVFYKGLSSDYHGLFRPFGYRSGGYIFIQLP